MIELNRNVGEVKIMHGENLANLQQKFGYTQTATEW